MKIELTKSGALRGKVIPPPDKSISHRAVIISSLASGKSAIRNFLRSGDTLSTVRAMRALGVPIEVLDSEVVIEGRGLHGLREPSDIIDCGNSGTTMRLLAGVLAGHSFLSVLTGDSSLRRRPMGRVIIPLKQMGASIMARQDNGFPPMAIRGGNLKAIRYEMPMASAQVKSCLLLAGLYADGVTEVIEPGRSRDHTERMLPIYGADVYVDGPVIKVRGGGEMKASEIEVPGDFSSAAFFIGAALMVKDSEIRVRGVGLNPLRTGFLNILDRMGANIVVEGEREVSGEPVGDIICRYSSLKGVDITGEEIPSMIDEFPILCVVASVAEGVTNVRGAGELRVKESDRVSSMAEGLRAMGVVVEEQPDGLSIKGSGRLVGSDIHARDDHRVAMSFSVAALAAEGKTVIDGAEAADISFPGFYDTLRRLSG